MAAIPIVFSELYIVAKFFLNLLLLKLTTLPLFRSPDSRSGVASATDEDRRRRLIDEKYPHFYYHHERRSEEDCAVCLCEFEKGDAVRELGCRHTFHQGCVDTWFAMGARKTRAKASAAAAMMMTCPLCRSGVLQPGDSNRRWRRADEVGPTNDGDSDDSLDWGQQQFFSLLSTLRGDYYRQIIINQ
ncbi:unnamed protein product [Linum tenue]|uniref:RING-type domain-containing protein n=1 Tax=Linum tenue TaxID=586396 RepID=A0AAV0L303_9ROSI|nr:unnamed protein product [Linum tenue]